jgi:hypothetical protein
MRDIYAMRRANGDWFALENHEGLRVPLFQSSQAGRIARLRNFGMLLFEPVALNARLLKEIVPPGAGSYVDFCIVEDPFASLAGASPMGHAQLGLQMSQSGQHASVSPNGNGLHISAISPPRQM